MGQLRQVLRPWVQHCQLPRESVGMPLTGEQGQALAAHGTKTPGNGKDPGSKCHGLCVLEKAQAR